MSARGKVHAGLVRVDQLRFHPSNVRRDLGDLRDLVESVEAYGVLQPIVVERYGDAFQVRMGHRRVAAAQIVGLRVVPALICTDALDEKSFLLQAVEENVTRSGIRASDKQRVVNRLRELGCSWRQVAAAFHVTPKTVAGWVIGDDDDSSLPRASNPRRRAVLRLIAAHRDQFDQLLAEERERRDMRCAGRLDAA